MKEIYNRYNRQTGELQLIKKKLTPKNKLILSNFIEECSINAGVDKLKKIERCIIQFYDIIEKDLDKINKKDVDSFLILLNHSDRSFWYKNEIKIYLKRFLLWKYKDLDMIKNIKLDSKRLNEEKVNENNLLTKEDIDKLLRVAERLREKVMIIMLFETGCRPQELLNLKWKNIKFEDGYADVSLFSTKTEKSRTIPVKKSVVHLKRWNQEYCYPNVKPDDLLFPSPFNRKKPISTTALNGILKRLGKKAKLNKDIWTYLFRHTRCTELYEELPQQICEKLFGHKNMAQIYAHISNKKAGKKMLDKIYNVEEITPEQKNKYDIEIEELKKITSKLNGDFLSLLKNPNVTKMISEEESKKMNVNKISKKERELYNSLKKTN